MKNIFFKVPAVLLVFFSCSTKQNINYEISFSNSNKKLTPYDTIRISLNTKKDIDSAIFFIDKKEIKKNYFIAKSTGEFNVKSKLFSGKEIYEISKKFRVYAKNKPSIYEYKLIKTYPHDIKAYTQGLEFINDTLYESTGQYGTSSLRKVDYKTGKVLKKLPINKSYFTEGITHFEEKIIQLTWKENIGFVYDRKTFKLLDTFEYNKSPEGWGLCSDGNFLYKTDGSYKLWKIDPKTFEELESKDIVTHNNFISKVNELEYANGLIYANTYQFSKDVVIIIDPKTGIVIGVIDFSGLKQKVKNHNNIDVFNGIAFHPSKKTFFVTGKNWNKLFEVEIFKKN